MPKKSFKREVKDLFSSWNDLFIPPQLQAQWQRVWETYMSEEQSRTWPIRQVRPLAFLGSEIAMQSRRYMEAVDIWTPYFQHPDLLSESMDDQIDSAYRRCNAYLLAGNIERAIDGYRSILSSGPEKKKPYTGMLILEGIREYCYNHDPDAKAEQELIDLVEEAKTYSPTFARPPANPRPQTYKELAVETFRQED